MSTFQYIIGAVAGSLSLLLPAPPPLITDVYEHLLHWEQPSHELMTLILCSLAGYLIYHFRYDWLGIFSALIKSILKPASLGPQTRSLDQHILIFVFIVMPALFLAVHPLHDLLAEVDFLNSPLVKAGLYLGVAFGFHFSKNWNKRSKGLNHVRLIDALLLAGLSLLSAHSSVSWIALLWIGFALTNYNFEAIFKYSYILLSIGMLGGAIVSLQQAGLGESIRSVGILNSIAVVVISLTLVYFTVETLQKSMSEQTFKTFRNGSILLAIFYGVLYFKTGAA